MSTPFSAPPFLNKPLLSQLNLLSVFSSLAHRHLKFFSNIYFRVFSGSNGIGRVTRQRQVQCLRGGLRRRCLGRDREAALVPSRGLYLGTGDETRAPLAISGRRHCPLSLSEQQLEGDVSFSSSHHSPGSSHPCCGLK